MKNMYSLAFRFSFFIIVVWFCAVVSAQPKMECFLTMPKELVFDSTSRNYIPNPFKVEVTLVNKGDSNAIITRIRLLQPAGILLVPDTTIKNGWLLRPVAKKIGDTLTICVQYSFSNHPDIMCCDKIWIPPAIMTDVELKEVSPSSFYLGQNYPNPFTQMTNVDLPLLLGEGRGEVVFKVYDVFGREVLDLSKDVISNFATANLRSSLVISNSQLPSQGIYFYRLTIGNESQTKMMILVK